MKLTVTKIRYSDLNARQQENYNFQKISAVLADYGFSTIRLSDDLQGADFLAQHADGKTILKIQLKGRLYFSKKYQGKDLWICFREKQDLYLIPHDEALKAVLENTNISSTVSWKVRGKYGYPQVPKHLKTLFEKYKIEV